MEFQSEPAFFGLTPLDKEVVLLEPWFLLGYYYGMTIDEYLRLPIVYKRWLIERINKEIKKASENGADIPSKGTHHNSPDIRAMTGKAKQFGMNGRTQRFT